MARSDGLAAIAVTVIGGATIAVAWWFELVGGYVPCALCLQERVPYYVGVPIALVAALIAVVGGYSWLTRLLLLAAAAVFAYGTYLGVYHAGAEWGWWLGPADCGAGAAPPATSATDLLSQIQGMRIVSCTEASWRFPSDWGLSFAGWNAAASLFLTLVALWGAVGRSPVQAPSYGSRTESQ